MKFLWCPSHEFELQYPQDRVVLFKSHWFGTTRGVQIVHPHGLVEIKHGSTLAFFRCRHTSISSPVSVLHDLPI